MIFLGRDSEDEQVYLDDSRSRAVLICGKRGSGKSYTMGVFLEELAQRDDVLVIVADPMCNFHTMSLPNREQEKALWEWGVSAKEVPVRLLVPGDPQVRYGSDVIAAFEGRGVQSDDVDSLNRLSHDYMARELKVYLRQLNRTGEAIMVDDTKESVGIVQIRPRRSKHGGAEG
jgi:DNA helicase HerA-like ATPase